MRALRLMMSRRSTRFSMPTAPLLPLLLLWTVGMVTSHGVPAKAEVDDDDVSARMRRMVDTRRVGVPFATPSLQSNEAADGISGSGLRGATRQPAVMTKEQWQGRERSRQRRLFLIQQQLMASFGFRHRPNVTSYPRMSRGDIDRLVSDINSNGSRHDVMRKHPARRVFLLRATCVMPGAQSDVFNSRGQYNNNKNSSSSSAGSVVDVESAMRLFFNVDALTDGEYRHRRRDEGVSVKSAVLRLYWTGLAPAVRDSGRRGYHRRSSPTTIPSAVAQKRMSKTMLIRRRRPPVNKETLGTSKGTNGPEVAGGRIPADGFRVAVYRLTRPRAANQTAAGRKLIRVVHHRTNESLIQVNIKSAVEEWIKKPNKNYGLEVVVTSSRRSSRRINSNQIIAGFNCSSPSQESENSTTSSEDEVSPVSAASLPTLDVTVFQRSFNHVPPKLRPPSPTSESAAAPTAPPGVNPRIRGGSSRHGSRRYERDTSATTTTTMPETDDNSECHVGTMVVSFEDMAWEWVIAPHRFTAGFCQGLCPAFSGNGTTTEDVARNGTLCCRPTKRAPLTLIFYDKDMNVSFSKLDDFIVTDCGCTDEPAYQPSNPIDAKFSKPCAS